MKALLDDIQQTLFDQAKKFRDEKTHVVHNMEELGAAVENGFAKAMWCGERACEDEIKEKFNASSRNMPFDQEKEWFGDTCVCCGKRRRRSCISRKRTNFPSKLPEIFPKGAN